ncbi:hypothetical protein [Smaragdicoccus niigatensis]|uniref:hypothetical protein n=1 Tax=Smaragdicoccus niigatensis TaxID=359359 RepID=UPI00037653C1|nr:hypothetical protein [Smaragdicoccus niigatensis]
MSTEPPNYYPPPNPPTDAPASTATQTMPNPAWGAPQPAATAKWSTKKTLAAVGIALGIAVAGGGAIYALSNSTSSSVQQGFGQGGAPGQGGGQFGGGMRGGMGMALHGEFVVSDGNGGYTTELTQEGTVTAVSDTSLTVKSVDGFSQIYTLTTPSSVAVGDTVNVRATESNGTATAISVRSGEDGFDRGPGGGQFPPGANGTGNP